MQNAEYWIEKLKLEKHPEGGYFKETYRSAEEISKIGLPNRFSGDRNIATSIYFLLTSDESSNFHRIKSDEIWYFHAGSPITIHTLDSDKNYHQTKLGPEDNLQATVPADSWFGATVDTPDSYALVGCSVSPGFDFDDFELAKREDLLTAFPDQKDIIQKLTRH